MRRNFSAPTPPPEASEAERKAAIVKAAENAKKVLELVKEKGFADLDDWARHFTSLGMAIVYVREGGEAAMKKRLEALKAASIPEEMKEKALAAIKASIPPKKNVEVAQKLLADPETKKMIEAVEKLPPAPEKK